MSQRLSGYYLDNYFVYLKTLGMFLPNVFCFVPNIDTNNHCATMIIGVNILLGSDNNGF